MLCDIILTKSNNKFIARAKEWPEVMAEGDTRENVIDHVKTRLADYLTNQIEVVQVEIALPAKAGNPLIEKFGWFSDDPTFDDLQAEIAAYREEIDQAMEQIFKSLWPHKPLHPPFTTIIPT